MGLSSEVSGRDLLDGLVGGIGDTWKKLYVVVRPFTMLRHVAAGVEGFLAVVKPNCPKMTTLVVAEAQELLGTALRVCANLAQ